MPLSCTLLRQGVGKVAEQRWKIHKFGGSSLADADCFRRVAGIVMALPRHSTGRRCFGHGRHDRCAAQSGGTGRTAMTALRSELIRLASAMRRPRASCSWRCAGSPCWMPGAGCGRRQGCPEGRRAGQIGAAAQPRCRCRLRRDLVGTTAGGLSRAGVAAAWRYVD